MTMKYSIIGLSSMAALLAGSQLSVAADLPNNVAVASAEPIARWQGLYAGVNAGGIWSDSSNIHSSTTPMYQNDFFPAQDINTAAMVGTGNNSAGYSGFIGGGQLGYNWQALPNVALGFETDFQGATSSGYGKNSSVGLVPGYPGNYWMASTSGSRTLNYLGTARGRLGYFFTPSIMVYGTGGLAYGGVSMNSKTLWQGDGPDFIDEKWFYGQGSKSSLNAGWTAGGGVEWFFKSNWSAKAEYLYYDLGSLGYNYSAIRPVPGFPEGLGMITTTNAATRFNGNILRAGVNYHFSWANSPVVAKY